MKLHTTIKLALFATLMIITLAIIYLLERFNDVVDHHYKNYNSLIQSETFSHGWVPGYLPKDVSDIHIRYSIDSNRVIMRFTSTKNHFKTYNCQTTTKEDASKPDEAILKRINWWLPKKIMNDIYHKKENTEEEHTLYKCSHQNKKSFILEYPATQFYYWNGIND